MSYIFAAAVLVFAMAHNPARASEADLNILYRECGPQLKLSDKGCTCIKDMAAKQLNKKQLAFVAAAVTKNRAKMTTLQGQLTGDEMMKAAQFMTQTPQICARK